MKRYGILIILIFFSSSIHAANCIPKVKDKKVTIEYFDGKGNIIRSETHRVRSKKKYKGLVSNEKVFKKLEKDKTGNIKIRSSKLDLKSGGMTTRVSTRDGTSLAKIGGCPVSKLKFYDRIGKEKPPFIHISLIEAAKKAEVQQIADEKTSSSAKLNSPKGKDSIGSTSAIVAAKPSNKATSKDTKKTSHQGSPEIAGEWSGMLHCLGVNLFFDIEIQSKSANQLSAVFKAEPKVMERKGLNWKPEKINTSMQGTYNPELAIFNLQSINAPNTQAFELVGIVEPGDEKMAAYAKSRFYNTCSYAIASKKSLKKTIKSIVKQTKFTPKRYSSKGITRQQCDANIQEWVQQLNTFPGNVGRDLQKYAAIQLFQDQYFKPHFGESFKKMSKSDMMKTSFQLQSGCRQKIRTHKVSAVIPYLNAIFENNSTLSRGEVFMYPVAKDIVKTWAAWAKDSITKVSNDPNSELDLFLQDSKKVSSILWPTDTVDFEFEIAKAKQRSNTKLLLADIQDQITSGDNGIQDLLALSKRSLSKRSSRRSVSSNTTVMGVSADGKKQATDMITAEINEYALPAVRKFASAQTTVNDVRNLQPVASNQTLSSLNRYLSSEKRNAINATLADRKEKLLSELATEYNNQFERDVNNKPPGIDALRVGVAMENRISGELGNLTRSPSLMTLANQRQQRRARDLAAANDVLVAEVTGLSTVSELDNWQSKYLLKRDRQLPQARSIVAALNERKKVLAPFSGKSGHRYLNAIYGGDFDLADQLDADFVAPYKRAMSNDGMKAAGHLMNLFAKTAGYDLDYNKALEKSFDAASLIVPVFAVYLIDYESVYGACLGSDAVRMKKTTTSETVYRNGHGIRTHSIKHPDIIEYFVIPGRFKSIFHDVGLTEPDSSLAHYIDGIFGRQGRINARDLVAATRKMMSDYACDSALIKRMERQMTYYFARYRGEKRQVYEALFK